MKSKDLKIILKKEIKALYKKNSELAIKVAHALDYKVKVKSPQKKLSLEKLAAHLDKEGFSEEAKKVRKVAARGWESLPKGWTEKSAKSFWSTLTGDNKHKITKCMTKMEGKVSNAGAFCASLAHLVKYSPKLKPGQKGPWALEKK